MTDAILARLMGKIAELSAINHLRNVELDEEQLRTTVCQAVDAIPFRRVTGPGQVKQFDFLIRTKSGCDPYILKVEHVQNPGQTNERLSMANGRHGTTQFYLTSGQLYILDLSGLGGEG